MCAVFHFIDLVCKKKIYTLGLDKISNKPPNLFLQKEICLQTAFKKCVFIVGYFHLYGETVKSPGVIDFEIEQIYFGSYSR